jgi:hypothetical protein
MPRCCGDLSDAIVHAPRPGRAPVPCKYWPPREVNVAPVPQTVGFGDASLLEGITTTDDASPPLQYFYSLCRQGGRESSQNLLLGGAGSDDGFLIDLKPELGVTPKMSLSDLAQMSANLSNLDLDDGVILSVRAFDGQRTITTGTVYAVNEGDTDTFVSVKSTKAHPLGSSPLSPSYVRWNPSLEQFVAFFMDVGEEYLMHHRNAMTFVQVCVNRQVTCHGCEVKPLLSEPGLPTVVREAVGRSLRNAVKVQNALAQQASGRQGGGLDTDDDDALQFGPEDSIEQVVLREELVSVYRAQLDQVRESVKKAGEKVTQAELAVARKEAEKPMLRPAQLPAALDALVATRKRLKTARAVLRTCEAANVNLEDRITSQVLAKRRGVLF